MKRMLHKDSATYATHVTASFPICYMLHETRENTRSLTQAAVGGLSASMLTWFMPDLTVRWVVSLS
jgi:cycloeucalenol cycloisomerase